MAPTNFLQTISSMRENKSFFMKGMIKIARMRAVGIYEHLSITEPNSLVDVTVEKPNPSGHDLLVEVKAVSVNPIDTKVRKRKPATDETYPKILGWDVAGVVQDVGDACALFKKGDEVFYAGDISRPGGNSQFHLVDERIVGRKPLNLSFTESAALPLTSLTASESLFDRLGISMDAQQNQGKTILMIGAAGGVGSIAIQLAKLAGLTVIGTASRPISQKWCDQLGADHIINHHQPLAPQLQSLGFATVDLIFCLYQTDQYWTQMAEVIAPQGKICAIVDAISPVDLNLMKKKSVTFAWESMFTRPLFQTDDLLRQHHILNRLADWVEEGKIKTTVQENVGSINAHNLRLAHQKLESGKMIGKIVLTGFE